MKKIKLLICSLFLLAANLHATNYDIDAGNYYYLPQSLTVNIGDSVTWTNIIGFHNVNFDINSVTGNSFNNPVSFISTPTASSFLYTHVFNVPGTYSYDCSVGSHAANGMVGTIVVNVAPSNSIYDIVSNSPDHTTLKVAIDACGLDGVLSDPGTLTLFAPTDAAFDLLPVGTLNALLNDIPQLTDILKHHVVGASVMSTALSNNQVVTTLLGTNVTVTINSMGIFIDNAQVIVADIVADNGVVHVIDAVLLPTSIYDIVSNSTAHTTLKVAIDACGLDGVLSDPGSLTLFAPTDAAFDLLPVGTLNTLLNDIPQLTDILKHHVVGAGVMSTALSNNQVVTTLLGTNVTVTINSMGIFIDNAQVIVADLIADNGVVHVIDAVLLPTPTSVSELNHLDKEYLYSVNILGEKVSNNLKNQIIFNVFKDGSVEKVFNK